MTSVTLENEKNETINISNQVTLLDTDVVNLPHDYERHPDNAVKLKERAEIKALRKERKRKMKTPKQLASLRKEEINNKRKKHHIHVQGSDIPSPLET